MSKYEMKDGTGSLFKNERKEKDTHADYRGECLVDGVAYYMDAWLKTAESGRKWMSFSFKPKEKQPGLTPPQRDKAETWKAGAPGFRGDVDSDIPF
jgi:hypothetical protein